MRWRIWPCLAVAAFAFAGCANHPPDIRVNVPFASVNGHPERTMVDTGASSSLVFSGAARRAGLGSSQISAPVPVIINRQKVTAPMARVRLPWIFRLAFWRQTRKGPEMLVGWPEIRSDILIFDSEHRMIRAVETLPPETAGWMKLKVIPYDWLLLEIPLANGKRGAVEVDTGSAFGVMMPPGEWRKWRKAHPGARVHSQLGGVGSFGLCVWHDTWTDEFKLGPIDLTDLSVQNMPASQAAFLRETGRTADVWSIGMNVLDRMDLVVDGRNGVAYVHPRPAPGPPYPGVKRPGARKAAGRGAIKNWNWTLADVPIKADNLFVLAGNFKASRSDPSGAVDDFGQALAINSNNAQAFQRRAVARQIMGHFSGAVSDYDHAMALSPHSSDWDRLCRLSLLWRIGRAGEAGAADMADFSDGWSKTLALFLAGKMDESALLSAAEKRQGGVSVAEQSGLALYYIAMRRLSAGDTLGAADLFTKYRALADKDDDEFDFAGAELARLKPKRQRRAHLSFLLNGVIKQK